MAIDPKLLFIGIRGAVLAIDRDSGEAKWQAELKGSDFVTVMVQGGALFAASKGRLYRLDSGNGAIKWCNELPGLGWGIVSIAGASQTEPAAEKKKRDAEAAAHAAAV